MVYPFISSFLIKKTLNWAVETNTYTQISYSIIYCFIKFTTSPYGQLHYNISITIFIYIWIQQ